MKNDSRGPEALKKTIDIILNRVYDQELVTTKLKKRTLKKDFEWFLQENCFHF